MEYFPEEFVKTALEQSETPLYLYDKKLIRENCRLFQQIDYDNLLVTFASMANANPEFLKLVKNEGLGIFVNSSGHLKIALEVGFKPEQIVFTSSAMNNRLMQLAAKHDLILNLDSPGQLKRWWNLFPERSVGIRCNIGDRVEARKTRGGYFLGKNSRLGLTGSEIEELEGSPLICGLHLYLGTDIIDVAYFEECYSHICALADLFPNLEYLDFGGGFGVTTSDGRTFDIKAYGKAVTRLMNKVSQRRNRKIQLILEPGRIIGGEAGWFVAKVVDIKIRGKKQYVGIDASTAQFSRPLMYPDSAYHPLSVLDKDICNSDKEFETSVYGCSTYSRDFFVQDIPLPRLKQDDIVVFAHAGSYSASSFTTFLGFEEPEEIFL
ncbi:MAG: hypothetical protein PF689_01735 [Deltaproteobacteria bacterium]|jgi:diaminopimelate decarboxylase|nr:hypothetical protein [Deltaproteobacteria bacterium]